MKQKDTEKIQRTGEGGFVASDLVSPELVVSRFRRRRGVPRFAHLMKTLGRALFRPFGCVGVGDGGLQSANHMALIFLCTKFDVKYVHYIVTGRVLGGNAPVDMGLSILMRGLGKEMKEKSMRAEGLETFDFPSIYTLISVINGQGLVESQVIDSRQHMTIMRCDWMIFEVMRGRGGNRPTPQRGGLPLS